MSLCSASLNAERRRRELERLAGGDPVDVVVIGGGVTGAGVALDAASRGLRVALVERHDLASGTSGMSSKLIHGGLRYLRQLQVGVAWESARERHILMTRTAPHLVRPLPFLVPLDAGMPPTLARLTEAGVRAGDVLRRAAGTPGRTLPSLRRISREEALRLAPALGSDGLRGALLFWDGQLEDDARLVIALARTAAAHGAVILTHCEATAVDLGAVGVRDTLDGSSFRIRTRRVVNAAGVWASEHAPSVRLRPSRGAHVLVPSAALGDPRAAVIVPVPQASARWVGATPAADGLTIIGVTDEEHSGPIDSQPAVNDAERDFLLGVLNRSLARPLHAADVSGGYAGFRPLLAGSGGSTADLSRRHAIVADPARAMLTIVGGKLTTYRRMAEDVVNRLPEAASRRCRTTSLPLVGAAPPAVLRGLSAPERLVRRYGIEAPALLALAAHDPSLLEPVVPGAGVLGVELVFGARHEGALTISDLLDRRTRLGLVPELRRAAEAAAAGLARRAA